MKWLLTLLITAVAHAQPSYIERALDAKTPADLIRITDEYLEGQGMPAVQSAVFDNGFTSEGGLTLALARAGTAYDEAGQAMASNVARYANSKLIAGAPQEPVSLSGFTSSSFRPLWGDPTGSQPFVVRQGTAALHVHNRTDPERYYNNSETAGTYVTTLGTNGDILNGQTGASGGTAAIANHEFFPGSAAVWKGYVVVGCAHLYDDGAGYDSVGCALAYTTVARLAAGTDPWILLAVTETVDNGVAAHHQAWSLTKWEVSDTLCVFVWCDYGTSDRNGGNAQVSILDISSGSPVWSHVRLDAEYLTAGSDDEHYHCGGLIIDGDGDWHLFWSIGDGYTDNRLGHLRIPAADVAAKNWGSGTTATDATHGDTGIGGSYVIETPHANWGSPEIVWGGTDAGTTGRAYRHNQLISMCQQDTGCTKILCGTDETAPGVISMTWNDTLGVPEWGCPYLPAMSSNRGDGVVNFVIAGPPGGPFIAKIGADGWDDAGTGGSGEADLEAAVIYSPDGENWTQILDWPEAAQYAAVLHAGRVFLGASTGGTAAYLPSVPTTRSAQPLQIASTPANSMASVNAATFNGSKSSGVSLADLNSDLSDLPSAFGGEGPPCHRNNMFLVNVTGDLSADRNHYGQGTIATGLPNSFTDICVVMWVRAIPYDGVTYNNKATAGFFSRLQKTNSPNEASPGGAVLFDADQWVPVTLWYNKSQFSPDTFADSTWSLRLQFRADGLNANTSPCHYVVAIEGVYLDGGLIRSNGGVAAGGSALAETATIGGVNKHATWSVYAELQMAQDQWDNRTGGGTPGGSQEAGSSITSANAPVLFRLNDSAGSDYVEVRARPDLYEIDLDVNTFVSRSIGNDKWWRRGDNIPIVITCDGATTTLYFEATDGTIKSVSVSQALEFDQIVSGDPMLWSRFVVREGVDPDPESSLRTLANNGTWQRPAGGVRTRERNRAR